MAVPENIVIMWPSTVGSIPSGWDRVGTYDALYPKGTAAGVDPYALTGGATTHTHGSSSHSHSRSHGHGSATCAATTMSPNNDHGGGASQATQTHTHTGTSGNSDGSNGSGSTSWGTGANDPSHYKVIFIASDGTPGGYPDNCLAMYKSASVPSGWAEHAGSRNRFPKGADASGDGGGTGGTGSHTHAAGSSHTHSIGSHSHGAVTSSGPSATVGFCASKGEYSSTNTHKHSMSLSSGGSATSGAATPSTSGTTYTPAFRKLLGIENTSGGDIDTIGVIVMWAEVLSAIPAEYFLCDGSNSTLDMRGQYIQFASSGGGDIDGTGGTVGHTHSGGSHSHTVGSHTHTIATGGSSGGWQGCDPVARVARRDHTHAGTSPGNTTSASGAANVTTTSDTQPPFRTMAFLEQGESIATGGAANMPLGLKAVAAGII